MASDEDEPPERVRILSTLAANRPPSKRASSRRSRPRRGGGSSWQFKALLSLMALGIVGLLAGFAMVLAQGHPESQTKETFVPAARALAAGHAPSGAAARVPEPSPPVAPDASRTQSAVIEDMAPAQASTLETGTQSAPTAIQRPASHDDPAAVPPADAPRMAATDAVALTPSPTAATETRHSDKPQAKPARAETRSRSSGAQRGQDADVALLEAMFTHTRAPRATPRPQRLCEQQPQAKGCPTPR